MATTFTELLKVISAGVGGFTEGLGGPRLAIPTFKSQTKSMSWLLNEAKKVRKTTLDEVAKNKSVSSVSPGEIMKGVVEEVKGKKEDDTNVKKTPAHATLNTMLQVGDMLMYIYDPKTKNKLPYYDTFPLVIPIEIKADGFLGLNMHYLPPSSRAILMDNLYSLLNNTVMDKTTRIMATYEVLKGASKFTAYKPCLKRYLSSHIRSARVTVHPTQWDMVLMLPTARFVKADQLRVWNESLDKIRGIKRASK